MKKSAILGFDLWKLTENYYSEPVYEIVFQVMLLMKENHLLL